MKYIILVPDGMADMPSEELKNKTPMTVAVKPAMDYLAANGINGLAKTVPDGMVPESDTANLALMGYDPRIYSKGRSPLEALSMGIDMQEYQTAIRANLVTISDTVGIGYGSRIMLDHSADEISTEDAAVLIDYCDKMLCGRGTKLYPGVSYRHCLIYDNAPDFTDFERPHDIIGRAIGDYLPQKTESAPYLDLMKRSFDILNNHPLNLERAARGLKKANSLWLWSPGKKPRLPSFKEKTGLDASVICAVDLIKGIGICAGMDAPQVEGATGTLDTNYTGKLKTALAELKKGKDLVFVHIEAPDECGHRGEAENKIKSIENIDRMILAPIIKELDSTGEDYRILLTPDHPTPYKLRTHTNEPVPFVIYDSSDKIDSGISIYNEKNGKSGGVYVDEGFKLIDLLLVK